MAKRIKITVLFESVSHGLVYQRIRIPFKRLDPAKFEWQVTTFSDQFVHYDNRTDIFVFVHPSMHEEMQLIEGLKKAGKRVIVDIDDLLTDLPSSHPESDMLSHCKHTVPEILMRANYVTTSTEYLARTYSHLNSHIAVIPNALDTELIPESYKPAKKHYHTSFTTGWCGGKTHQDDQYEFIFGLERFLEENADAKAQFKGLMPHRMTKLGAQVFFNPNMIHYLDYQGWLGTVPWDVCLVGLTDHPFNDAKSDLRFIECARHGIPTIVSPRDDFDKHVREGRALGATTNDAFYMQLGWMKLHPEWCTEMSKAAHDYVMSHRLDHNAAKAWEAVLLATMES